jgi:hypothetical protein
MIKKLVDLIKKSFKIISNMFTEDSIAAAQIAKIFGSELMSVQESARTDSGSQPEILKMHPKQFLGATPQHQARQREDEQRILRSLQMQAESAHPLPQPIAPPPEVPQTQQAAQPIQSVRQQTVVATPISDASVWEKINFNLERIANRLEQVDLSTKKKRIKRITK